MPIAKPHVALLASPGMGHVTPVVELGKLFASLYKFNVTIFILDSDTKSLDIPNNDLIHLVCLPPPDVSGSVEPTDHIVIKIIKMMGEAILAVRSIIKAMVDKPTALIVDLFGTEALKVADEFKMLKYVLFASNAYCLALTTYYPTLDQNMKNYHVVLQNSVLLPGCELPVRFEDTLEAYLDPNHRLCAEYTRIGLEIPTADGILVNTWQELEPETLSAFKNEKLLGRVVKTPVYPVGPLTRPVLEKSLTDPVFNWLDKQPDRSVIYVSFGTGGTLSSAQMIELAYGLELSEQRFVWVVHPPMDHDPSGSYFDAGGGTISETPSYLPDKFCIRTRNTSFMIYTWAPQAEILAHRSVGGFLSHCGWNSILESIVNEIPLIAWPLYAEQKMNATMLTEQLKIAVRSEKLPSEGVIKRTEIERMIRKIMVDEEGYEIRKRLSEIKKSRSKGIGSSYESLSRVAKECEISLRAIRNKALGA